MDYSDIFIWYCCIIGISGNLLVFFLFILRLSSLKRNVCLKNKRKHEDCEKTLPKKHSFVILPSTSVNKAENATVLFINKNVLIDLNHNWTLYLYFLGIIVSDIFIIANWILSKIQIDYETNFRILHNLDFDDEKKQAFLSLADYLNFSSLYNIKNHTNFTVFKDQSKLITQSNTSFFLDLDFVLNSFDNQQNSIKIKVIDLQGVCQIYYFLTNASLHCAFAYMLIAVLDRLVKWSVINRDVAKQEPIQKLIITTNEERNEKKTFIDQKPQISAKQINLDSLSYKTLGKTIHKPLIRQLFGKSSALFVGIFIFYLLFHLLWVYGVLYDTYVVSTIDNFLFHLIEKDKIDLKSFSFDLTEINKEQIGSFQITAMRPHCQLLNLKNYLPMFVMSFDLLILLIIGISTIIATFILIRQTCKKRKRIVKSRLTKNLSTTLRNKLNKYKPLGVNVVIYLSVFTCFFSMPSVITRNILMNIIMSLNIYPKQSVDFHQTDQPNFVDFNQTSNQTIFSTGVFEKNLIPFLNILLNWLDFLLLISSSHKFFIFVFECNLISLFLKNSFFGKFKERV